MVSRRKLGDVLLSLSMVTEEQLYRCLQLQTVNHMKLGEILIAEGYLQKEQLNSVLEFQFGVPFADLSMIDINPAIPKLISEHLARRHGIIPIKLENNVLTVAMADPFDIVARDDVKIVTGYQTVAIMSPIEDINQAINQYYDSSEVVQKTIEEMKQTDFVDDRDDLLKKQEQESEEEIAKAPVVRIVNTIMLHAINLKASDIHIEAFEKASVIRCRIDGELKELMRLPKSSHAAVITRIKILGGMDIAETRKPQDGRIESVIDGVSIDMRISILPTVNGEKVVIRILRGSSILVTKEQLGFTSHNIGLFNQVIKSPEGIILLTGPTGSGKTTTLYTVLRELNKPSVNIITVEDPVEYKLEGVNQVQVNARAGLTFATGLRSILRQDPDIVMVGEIRDTETAEIAVRAAITGHLVLSTLHTNDAVSSISRLIDMGCEPFMVSTSLKGVVAQRLVRRICPRCVTQRTSTQEEMMILGMNQPVTLCMGKGCNNCGNSGYSGRQGIHEILLLDRELRSMINRHATADEIKERARQKGMRTLADSARDLVLEGRTTLEEMVRVAFSLDE
ncbi:MAG: Flp pilus assembly complex ATPase component TadA [Clostridiales bacterium]|nr:Flp pilus assembly complex ATPase component TadA [Clostridiales bacterium]MDR2749458.1 Flp pilus assembly complex ATPase component TadA [Clostridiales bacterium]